MSESTDRRRGGGCLSVAGRILLASVLILVGGGLLAIALGLWRLERGPGVAVLDISDELMDERPVLDQLERLLDNPDTKALVVRVDSPGGVITVVEEIYNALKRAREHGMPVVASMGSLGASGAYYVCLAAERIFANNSSLTGSIGVMVEYPSAAELFNKIGLKFDLVTSGEFKSTGALSERLTEHQRDHVQKVINELHLMFIELVQNQRGIERKKVEELADGRVFTGRQALDLGLVDQIGDLKDAIAFAAKRGGIEGEPRVIRPARRPISMFEWLSRLGSSTATGLRRSGPVPKYVLR